MQFTGKKILRILAFTISVYLTGIDTVSAVDAEVPAIINYSKEQYQGQKQNWQIAQLDNGLMIFANTGGLMLYNGVTWKLYPMPHREIVRTILVDQQCIYVGSYGEFGFWEPDGNGQLQYTSLTPLIDRDFTASEEIWNIVKTSQAIYFHSFGTVFKYDHQQVTRITPPFSIRFMHLLEPDRYILQVIGHGIMLFENDEFIPLIPERFVSDLKVTGISRSTDGTLLIATEKNGLYEIELGQIKKWVSEAEPFFTEHQINKLIALKQGGWAVGTISDGLLILSPDGKVKYHINKNSGLQNNTILSLFEDSCSNLWIGLDDGVDLLDRQTPVIFYRDISGQIGSVFDAIEYDHRLFVGSNQGLFFRDRTKSLVEEPFILVPGSQGQVLQLKMIDETLFCGHNNGTFTFSEQSGLIPISRVSGGWYLLEIPGYSDKLIQGTYTGIVLFHREKGQWQFHKTLDHYTGGAKELAFDEENWLWVANPYRGLHRLRIDFEHDTILDVEAYSETNGLPSDYKISLIQISGRVIFQCENQYFTFNKTSRTFEPFDFGFTILPPFDKIIPIDDGLQFLVRDNQLELVRHDTLFSHFNLNLVRGSEQIIRLSDSSFLACLENGYAILDPLQRPPAVYSGTRSVITGFRAWNKSGDLVRDLAGDIISWQREIELSPQINRLEVEFASFDYTHQRPFRYQLSGFDPVWSPWSQAVRKEYTNLAPGTYEFKLQYEGSEAMSVLTINQFPAWHQTNTARVIFVLIIAGIVWLLIQYYDNRLKAHTRRMQIEKEREINRQRLTLQNQLLEKEVHHKSQELANSTMNLIQKNKVLLTLKEQISEIRQKQGRQFPDKQYNDLIRLIQQHMSNQEDWKLFETNFNDVHDNFFRMLRQEYPELTPGDLKLAAYLKMNLTSKEIAPLLNISIRGVENKRYRLRQKMGLAHDENLLDILLRY